MAKRIVIVVVDSLRFDALGVTNPQARTPTLDRLARTGVVLDRVYTSAPWTLPSLAALLTGQYAHRVGLIHWRQDWSAARCPTLFDQFAAAGYETASWVFDPTWLFTGLPAAGVRGSSMDEDDALDWLRTGTARDSLVFLHYWGTHIPYLSQRMPTATWMEVAQSMLDVLQRDPRQRPKLQALYRRAVERFSEQWLPRLLDALAAGPGMENTVLVITSDHGENWGEHLAQLQTTRSPADIYDLHGNVLNEATMRVPMLIIAPGQLRPGRLHGLARTVDLAPTLLDLTGLGATAAGGATERDGISLLPALRTQQPTGIDYAFAAGNRPLADVVTSGDASQPDRIWARAALWDAGTRWVQYADTKVHGATRAVYDLQSDPHERYPLGAERVAGSARLLDGWRRLARHLEDASLAPLPPRDEVRRWRKTLEE